METILTRSKRALVRDLCCDRDYLEELCRNGIHSRRALSIELEPVLNGMVLTFNCRLGRAAQPPTGVELARARHHNERKGSFVPPICTVHKGRFPCSVVTGSIQTPATPTRRGARRGKKKVKCCLCSSLYQSMGKLSEKRRSVKASSWKKRWLIRECEDFVPQQSVH